MSEQPLDRIYIRDLHARCIVGLNPDERREKQDVLINITLYVDLRAAGESDAIGDTVDYKHVKKAVLAMTEASEFLLIERLAARIADLCLEPEQVFRADVTVDKPGALRFARSVAVEISRTKQPSHSA